MVLHRYSTLLAASDRQEGIGLLSTSHVRAVSRHLLPPEEVQGLVVIRDQQLGTFLFLPDHLADSEWDQDAFCQHTASAADQDSAPSSRLRTPCV